MAPPLTLTFSTSTASSLCQARTTEAKASFTSNTSMSRTVRPLRCRTDRVAGMGPVSIMTGSEPTSIESTMRARALSPSSAALD